MPSFRYDAPELSPQAFAEELTRIVAGPVELDAYTLGGSVEACERAFARVLGKEKAVFMPTGTLANHLAVRALTGGRGRVLVQEQGHLYNDSGDCLQRLSGISAVPLGHGQAGFTLQEVEAAVGSAASARVRVRIGAIVMETPVRRRHGEMFNHLEMAQICGFARERGIALHLDGARLFIASAYTGIAPAGYAAPFDTVYVSLYKYFGSPCGGVLAGPAALLDGIHHERRMFGGALNQAWVFAAVAAEHLEGFGARFARVVAASESLKAALRQRPFTVTDIPNGTNIFKLEVDGCEPGAFQARMAAAGITLPDPEGRTFFLKMNESILDLPVDTLVRRFQAAAGGGHGRD